MPRHFISKHAIQACSIQACFIEVKFIQSSAMQLAKVMVKKSLVGIWILSASVLLGGCAGLTKNVRVSPVLHESAQDERERRNKAELESKRKETSNTVGLENTVGTSSPKTSTVNPSMSNRRIDTGFQVLSRKSVNTEASGKFSEATAAIAAKDYANAEALLLALISSFPEYASSRTNLALIYVNTGRIDEALPLLRDAIAIEPRDCIPRVQLALVERSRNNFVAAEQAYLGCLKKQPNNAIAQINLGILYELYMGRFEDALAAYDEYQQLVSTPDQRVAGWIANLTRRVKTTSQLAAGELYK